MVRSWFAVAGVVAALSVPHAAFASTPITLTTESGDADILSAPSTDVGVRLLYIVVTAGSPVQVVCWVRGGAIDGDTVWYRAVSPAKGWIAGAQLNVATEPSHGVNACKKPAATVGAQSTGEQPTPVHGYGSGSARPHKHHRHHGSVR